MLGHRFSTLVAAAALSIGLAGKAGAGGCCGGAGVLPAVTDEIYLVNQGPVFSGPGHALPRQLPDPVPVDGGSYPYVGYVYSGYPYGLQSSGGYPRGFHSALTGYPYADPPPYVYRAYHGSVRPLRRHSRYR
jgi:hypothetical protein